MAITKTEVVSVRVAPDIKAALVAAAVAERRSLASMLEVIILEYCRSNGISMQERIASLDGKGLK